MVYLKDESGRGALEQAGYALIEERKKGEWVAMIARRPG